MTLEKLRELIASAETFAVEFKGEEASALSDVEMVEGAVCLANRPGDGPEWLLVGVEDDSRITGPRSRHYDQTSPLRVEEFIPTRMRPRFTARFEMMPLDRGEADDSSDGVTG